LENDVQLSELARVVAARLAASAVARDKAGGTPKAERDLLRESGLLNAIIPQEQGGLGAAWPSVLSAVRCIARVDGSLAHVFGFHHLLLATLRLFGPKEQWAPWFADSAKNSWFWGNALNPLDRRTSIVEVASGEYSVTGTKSFCSGALDSDRLVISANPNGEARLVIAAIPTNRSGIRLHKDWDNIGQRQTDSGSVDFTDVRVFETEILKAPGPLGSVFASLRPCIAQLTLANVFLGIAEGAFQEAAHYTKTESNPWSTSGVETAAQDPYVLRNTGELYLELQAARALTDIANGELEQAWQAGDDLTPADRGRVAIAIASAKAKTTRTALDVTSRIFENMGAKATKAALGFDRFWRNVRTHTLHDPVEYKFRELGAFALNGELPKPSFYS